MFEVIDSPQLVKKKMIKRNNMKLKIIIKEKPKKILQVEKKKVNDNVDFFSQWL